MSRDRAEPFGSAPATGVRVSRREAMRYGAVGAAAVAGIGSLVYYSADEAESDAADSVFKGGAPTRELWHKWQQRGWTKEARHYRSLGRNVQCGLCHNQCLLEPGDRSRCRNRVNRRGKLYTLAYGNPCSFHVDPIEKKPLFHFLPGSRAFSIATAGCTFRCLNCQNWEISQKTPEQTKSADGEELRLTADLRLRLDRSDMERLSLFPEDVVSLAEATGSRSIAYTYSEPTSFYEYMYDTAQLARSRGIKNVWVTNGYIRQTPLDELCKFLDGANVDVKNFSEQLYATLNSGKLAPVLDGLKLLRERGVWFEVTNLVIPRHTDDMAMIGRMCDWLVKQLGPEVPLHFSRFHPKYKLDHLPPTPVRVLEEAKRIALQAGLRHIYLGNVRGVAGATTTLCPGCGKAVVERDIYQVNAYRLTDGKCDHCGRQVAGRWG